MLEKNTVVLDLIAYDELKEVERRYIALTENLKACQTRYDKNNNKINCDVFHWCDPTDYIKIDTHLLADVLDIEYNQMKFGDDSGR